MYVVGLILLFFPSKEDHDIRLARFSIYNEGNRYEIIANFDRADFLKAIYASNTYESEVLEQASSYIKSHLYYVFDGDTVEYEFSDIEYTETNIYLKGEILSSKKNLTKIFVGNTCLIEEVEGQMNIMEFFLNDKERFFRLDENRLTTTIKY